MANSPEQQKLPIDPDQKLQVMQFIGLNEEIKGMIKGWVNQQELGTTHPPPSFESKYSRVAILGGSDWIELMHTPIGRPHGDPELVITFLRLADLPLELFYSLPPYTSPAKPLVIKLTKCVETKYLTEWEEFIQKMSQVYGLNIGLILRESVTKTIYRASFTGDMEKYIYLPPATSIQQLLLTKPEGKVDEASLLFPMMSNQDLSDRRKITGYTPIQPKPGDFELVHNTLIEIREAVNSLHIPQ